jgi:predicted deacylase
MRAIGMLPESKLKAAALTPYIAKASQWVRAPISGIFVTRKKLGERVVKGDKLGFITNPFGDYEYTILSPVDGIIIGNSILPLANEGDGIYHIATFDKATKPNDEELYPYIDPDLM